MHRAVQTVPLLLGVIVVNFLLIHLAPGDPVQALVGDFPAPAAYVQAVRHEFGLDRPLGVQLVRYLEHAGAGDFGYSFAQRRPVLRVILERAPATALLVLTAWAAAAVLGPLLGIAAALRRNSVLDHLVMTSALAGYSIPVFWLGQLLVLAFALWLGWLPAEGMQVVRRQLTGGAHLADVGRHLILPAIALCPRYLAVNARLMRTSLIDALHRDYVTTARAKGLPASRVVTRHAVRNAVLPVVTIMGFDLGFLLTGSALVETVFAWPGVGLLLFTSLSTRDYPVLLGIFSLAAAVAVAANLVTDIVYGYLDPRIRYT
ncbi:MAG TPA: ABC transporter permease [bacterium]|nr:ABC transporter permease [bacterium]